MRRVLRILVFLLAGPLLTAPGAADEEPALDAPVLDAPMPAVQNRIHQLHTEIALGGALLPSDALSKEAGAVLGITYHFSDLVAWEIIHAQAYLDWSSDLRTQLENNFGFPSERFPVLRYALDSNFVISPIYAKLGLLNHSVVYLQIFGVIGAGAGLVYGGQPGAGSTAPGLGPHAAVLLDAGLGVRLWLSPRWSLRYDIREYVSIDTVTASVTPPLFMSLSVALSVGGQKR